MKIRKIVKYAIIYNILKDSSSANTQEVITALPKEASGWPYNTSSTCCLTFLIGLFLYLFYKAKINKDL